MKTITNYITEKAHFLVKKHVSNLKYSCAMSIDELTDGCYAKIKTRYGHVYLFKYTPTKENPLNSQNPLGYVWSVRFKDNEILATKSDKRMPVITNEGDIKDFLELTQKDYEIIDYVESNINTIPKCSLPEAKYKNIANEIK